MNHPGLMKVQKNKMRSQLFFLLLFVIPFLSPSCGVNLYVPNTLNTPLLHEKGDFSGSLGMVGFAPEPTFDFQAAYAVNDHLAVMANSSFMSNDQSSSNVNTHRLLEAGGGWYTTFLPHAKGWNIGRAEVLAGYGFGWAEDNVGDDRFTGRYNRAFIQPAFGFRGEWFEIIIAGRFNNVNFSDYREEINGRLSRIDQLGFTTFEPIITFSLGYQYVKFYTQTGGEAIMSGRGNYERVSSSEDKAIFNFGMRISPWKEQYHFVPPIALTPNFSSAPDSSMQALPIEITVPENEVTLCFQSGNIPADEEVIDIVFNATFLTEKLKMSTDAQCLKATIKNRGKGNLRFLFRDEGENPGGTILLTVQSGKEEKWFYFDIEKGKKEEVVLRVRE